MDEKEAWGDLRRFLVIRLQTMTSRVCTDRKHADLPSHRRRRSRTGGGDGSLVVVVVVVVSGSSRCRRRRS